MIRTYDLARALRDAGIAVVGGFHSSMEKECMRLLLRGSQPVVVCPARSLSGFRVPLDWRQPIADGRLLLISPFPSHFNRTTSELAAERNRFVFSLAQERIIPFASSGGSNAELCGWVVKKGLAVWTLDKPDDGSHRNGAEPISLDDFMARMRKSASRSSVK